MAFPVLRTPRLKAWIRTSIISLGLIASSVSSGVAVEADEAKNALKVVVDRAKVVRIAKPADTVIIGNPSIVDATIQDARTIVLTGRNFGVTNLIVLDSDGDPIVDETIVVQGHETNVVHIYRQAVRETLACSPLCENTLTIGDDPAKFRTINDQIRQRNALAESATDRR